MRLPEGFFAAGSGLGLGFANQFVRLSALAVGAGHRPERKCEQII